MIRVVESGRSIVLGSGGCGAHRAAGGVKVDRSGVVNRRVWVPAEAPVKAIATRAKKRRTRDILPGLCRYKTLSMCA